MNKDRINETRAFNYLQNPAKTDPVEEVVMRVVHGNYSWSNEVSNTNHEYTAVVADSHEIVREGISARLTEECGIKVIGEAEDGYNTIKICRQEDPDVLVMDLSMTRPSGFDTFQRLRELKPDLKILLMSSESNASEAYQSICRGAVGFMPRQAKSSHFVSAVNAIIQGYTCMPSDLLEKFFDLRRQTARTGNVYGLSPREIEVLNACADGARSKEVAEMLSISVRTVESHRNSIYRKTKSRDLEKISELVNGSE